MKGLNSKEVNYRINNGMINNENIKHSRTLKNILLSNLLTLFNFIHIVLFILVLTTGSLKNGTFIFVIIINIFISVFQEIKAKKIIEKLKIANMGLIKVIRDGKVIEIYPNEIVIHDLLYLKQGDSLCVDVEIMKSNGCEVDESIVTGESEAISKIKGDKLISGTIILCGEVYAKVISINKDTYTNKLIKEASIISDNSSYLKTSINLILKVVTFLIIPVGLLLFFTQYFYSNQTYSEAILSTVAGLIGMIPDGLVLLTSISLTIGVIKMASKKVIIQKLNGIELLSCVDVLCLDKTGTITDGCLDVIDTIYINNKEEINNIISNMIISENNATDKAILKYFGTKNNLEIIDTIPFSSARKYSLVKFTCGTYAIGAFEFLTNKKLNKYAKLKNYIDNGYRIVTFVKCNDEFNVDTNEVQAFIILKDNIRKNAQETLEYFKRQQVNIKIISGDEPMVVSNLLKQLSIENSDKFISGLDLPDDIDQLRLILKEYTIFGRVTPYQKQAIVKALKLDNTVGMIGDGVNDILALKEADCGIALANGVSAARNVSEVIITDYDFSILPSIVNEGRRVVNNIERVSSMYLIKTVYSFILSIFCIIFSHEYPFYPIQLTLIGATCVGIPSFFLALEQNYNKVKKSFLIKVFRNALPSGLCVGINFLLIILCTNMFGLDFELFRIVVVIITGYLNIRLLYNLSIPLNKLRKILILFCVISFIVLLIVFGEFFLINSFNVLSLLFTLIFILIDNYIILYLEKIYDKIVLKIDRVKRRKMVSEK